MAAAVGIAANASHPLLQELSRRCKCAGDRNVLAKLNGAAVGAGLKPGSVGLAFVAGGDAGAANRGAVCLTRSRAQAGTVAKRTKQAAAKEAARRMVRMIPVSAHQVANAAMIAGLFGLCRGSFEATPSPAKRPWA
jgi:hypothetical protein